MTVTVLASVDRLGPHLADLQRDDVLAVAAWRITPASDGALWLQRSGQIFKVQRGRRAAHRLRTLIEQHSPPSEGTPHEQDTRHRRIAGKNQKARLDPR